MGSIVESGRRSIAIDMLRGAAVLMVILRHWPADPRDPALLRKVAELGWIGVDLFFVLSGYLISTLLYRELDATGHVDILRFWLRRGLRIWPAYFAAFLGVICLSGLADGLTHGAWASPSNEWPNLVLVQNYFPSEVRWPHTWSLAVEEHFYLALPLLLLVFGRRRLPVLGLALCVICLVLRAIQSLGGAAWADLYYPTHLRFDALMTGVLVGYASHYHPQAVRAASRWWPLIAIFCVAVVVVTAMNPLETSAFTTTFGFTLLALAFGGLVMVAAQAPQLEHASRPARMLALIGVYSYTIYLTHGAMVDLPRYKAVLGFAMDHGGVAAERIAFILMAAVGGVLLSWLVEQPALRLRRRLTDRRASDLDVAARGA